MARHVIRIALGFLAAAFSASVALHLILAVCAWSDGGPSVLAGTNVVLTVAAGTLVIALNAFLPALLFIVVAERLGLRRWFVFALAGAAATFLTAVGIYLLGRTSSGAMPPTLLVWLVAAGAVAGLAYWLVAGRFSGRAKAARP